jgi:hypothetical protein
MAMLAFFFFIALVSAQTSNTASASFPTDSVSTISISGQITPTAGLDGLPSNITYQSISSTSLTASDSVDLATRTTLVGTATQTATSSAPSAANTQPCNNYVEFCERKYSNITEICAHNSPFVHPQNIASNQALDVVAQLNSGIRMLQGQVHLNGSTLHFCHTSCSLLDSGPIVDYFTKVADWLFHHPFEVVTILLGNADSASVADYDNAIKSSALNQFAYTPPKVPMELDDWPTLGNLILYNKRAIIFMDYGANQTEVPYILDEFSQLWETPFSPTDANFPCTVQRPPNLSDEDARSRLYMANHNLNLALDLAGANILIPDRAEIAQTNGITGFGSLGVATNSCTQQWGRPPNFLLVDYFNEGVPNGSVFQVAAQANGVNYTQTCCSPSSSTSRADRVNRYSSMWLIVLTVMMMFCIEFL